MYEDIRHHLDRAARLREPGSTVITPQHDGERFDPVAARWLARWRPQPVTLQPPSCTCADGRCEICN